MTFNIKSLTSRFPAETSMTDDRARLFALLPATMVEAVALREPARIPDGEEAICDSAMIPGNVDSPPPLSTGQQQRKSAPQPTGRCTQEHRLIFVLAASLLLLLPAQLSAQTFKVLHR